jgi:hypothetical protein
MATLDSSIRSELDQLPDRSSVLSQAQKKNYAERLSRLLAPKIANGLRADFDGITPDEKGKGQESKARTAKGFKKLDVNYSKPEIGLGLGVSIKTLNFRDVKSNRYTKNFTRIDNELRAEAHDYHERQPYPVMVAIVFLPADSCQDASKREPSSFGQAVRIFRLRGRRVKPTDSAFLFERIFIGLYESEGTNRGDVDFFDVEEAPPRSGPPRSTKLLSFEDVITEIKKTYDERNNPPFEWAEE